MHISRTLPDLREQVARWRQAGERIAFVPTMGNLHTGHLALVERARDEAEHVVVSIFVNPTQFGAGEDFESYPRSEEHDAAKLAAAGCELLFMPDVDTMYPGGTASTTFVEVPEISDILCGASRPGHFRGVATVVTRLLNMVQPDVAVFGEKDFQQLLVIRRMVRDLAMPVKIVGQPTSRENSGLALSSRNQYLSDSEREKAAFIYQLMQGTAERMNAGEGVAELEKSGFEALEAAGFEPDYFAIRRADDLAENDDSGAGERVILVAARLGRARLIDNLRVPGHSLGRPSGRPDST